MTGLIVLVGIMLVLLIFALAFGTRGGKRYSWIEFRLKTKEAGLLGNEAKQLHDAAKLAGVADPTVIADDAHELDKAIKTLINQLRSSGQEHTNEGIQIMDHAFALRRKIELDRSSGLQGVTSTRQITKGQKLRIIIENAGVIDSMLIENAAAGLIVSNPGRLGAHTGIKWQGKKISVYFWRRRDAGYVFDSSIHSELQYKSMYAFQIAHSQDVIRSQKRKSVRVQSNTPAYLYLVHSLDGAHEKPEQKAGLRCLINNLSEDGVSVIIGGRGRPGIQVKLQFSIEGARIVLSGVTRSIDWDAVNNRSILHIALHKPSPRVRNALRSWVYERNSGTA